MDALVRIMTWVSETPGASIRIDKGTSPKEVLIRLIVKDPKNEHPDLKIRMDVSYPILQVQRESDVDPFLLEVAIRKIENKLKEMGR